VKDTIRLLLEEVEKAGSISGGEAALADLKKRKLVAQKYELQNLSFVVL
jgi:hypothetical protein